MKMRYALFIIKSDIPEGGKKVRKQYGKNKASGAETGTWETAAVADKFRIRRNLDTCDWIRDILLYGYAGTGASYGRNRADVKQAG